MDNMQLWLSSSTDSINLNDSAEGFYLNPDLDGLTGLPEIRSVNGLNAGYDGGWTATQLWAARLITIRGVIALNDKAAVETKRKALAKLMAQGKNESLQLKFVSESGNVYTTSVRTTYCTMALKRVFWRQEYQIQLRADDPLIYDDGGAELVAILRVMAGVNGFEIPFEIPFAIGDSADPTDVNVGDEATYPLITLKGDLHSPTIVNLTTNQQMQVLADIIAHVEWKAYITAQTIDGYLKIQDGLQGAPLSLTHLYGNATQKTISGKNLFGVIDSTNTYYGVAFTTSNNTASAVGTTTKTPPAHNVNAIGGVSLNGNYPAYSSITATNSFDLPVGTYTLSATISNTGNTQGGLYIGVGDESERVASGEKLSATGSKTITVASGQRVYISIWYEGTDSNKNVNISATNIQLESGSTPTEFEQFVGGIPSPNPDFPQVVNTVSGEQTVKITGKNIFDKDSVSPINAYIASDGSIGYSAPDRLVSIPVMPNTTYTITAQRVGQIPEQYLDDFAGALFTSDTAPIVGSAGRRVFWGAQATNPTLNQTFTTSATENWLAIKVANVQRSDYAGTLATIQLEINDQATPFEPYQSQSYAIDLDTLELAKIGTYQDYIWNDNGTWKIHKAINKVVLDGSETGWNVYDEARWSFHVPLAGKKFESTVTNLFCDKYTVNTTSGVSNPEQFSTRGTAYNTIIYLFTPKSYISGSSAAEALSNFKTWLSTHPTTVYYALATPTDTAITDSDLIAQLDFIANLYGGVNNIMLIPSAGAQGEMEVSYATDKDVDYHEVVIDCQARTVTQDGQNLYPALAPGSEFIQLVPGQNRLYLTSTVSSDDGTAEVKFKKGNISI